ncbi:hypothetical protein D3C87_1287350 [compost metagenome]
MKLLVLVISLIMSNQAKAQLTRTFSCNGTYEDGAGKPFVTIHVENVYEENFDGTRFELKGEDSRIKLTGILEIKKSQEFLSVRVQFKDSGLTALNHNSQMGMPGSAPFNFVGVWFEGVGLVEIEGKSVETKYASFQCQAYRN